MTYDLISRQAAIDSLSHCQTYLFYSHDDDKKISLEDAEYELAHLPTADFNDYTERLWKEAYERGKRDAQPRKGKWIKGIGENGVNTSLYCDQCGYENGHWYEWNFCPHCGARMEESE